MNGKKRLGIVGCGRIAQAHAKRLDALGCELIFHSRRPESARRLAGIFSGARHVATLDSLLSDPAVHGVVVTSPPEFHIEHALRCLDAHKPCLIEKPLCVNRAEVERLAQALARRPTARLMVAENYLYKPSLALIRKLLAAGTLGKIKRLRMRKEMTQNSSGWKSGYGALFEGGIHFIAFMNEIAATVAPQTPLRVRARFANATKHCPERSSITQLEYADGFNAELAYSWETPSAARGVFQHSRLEGERGTLVFESNGLYARLSVDGRSQMQWPGWRDLAGYGGMMRDFLAGLENPAQEFFSDFAKSRRDLLTVFDAYDSAQLSPFVHRAENEARVHG